MSLHEIDTLLFFAINHSIQNSLFDSVMPFVTNRAELLFAPFIVWMYFRDRKIPLKFIVVALISVALADASGHILKDIIGRLRPCHALDNVRLLTGCGRAYSLPSNHAAVSFAVAAGIWFLRRDVVSYLLVFLAGVVGFSRVYVGVHYPLDVLAGILVGAVTASGAVLLYRWARDIYEKKSYKQALYFSVMAFSLFRIYFILTGPFDLSPDEAHYWEWSRRLDWSYYSKGPVIAYLIRAGTAVFGDTVFGVRIFAVVLSGLSSLIIFRLGSELFDERTGLASALLLNVVPLYSAYGILLTIDSPFIFFWVLSLYLFHTIVHRELPAGGKGSAIAWTVLGIAVGFGMLTKYTMAFFYLSGFLFIIVNRETRRLLMTKGPYLSFLASMAVFSPVFIWNARNDWVTFRHTAGQAHVADGLRFTADRFFEFIGSQLGVITPLLFILILVAAWKLRTKSGGSFLFWFLIPTVAFFTLKSLQGKVQANWALTGYATGFIAFSAEYIRNFEMQKRSVKVLVACALFISLLVTAVAHYPSVLNLPEKQDPTARLVGWRELGREASRLYSDLSSSGPAFVVSNKYQVASELAFYMDGQPATYCLNFGRRMNQYDLWPGIEGFIGSSALFVMEGERSVPEEVKKAFSSCERSVVDLKTRQKKTVQFTMFKCYDFRGIKEKPAERF